MLTFIVICLFFRGLESGKWQLGLECEFNLGPVLYHSIFFLLCFIVCPCLFTLIILSHPCQSLDLHGYQ